MESNRKRRGGFIKAKLVGLPFYKSAKNNAASTGQSYNNSKVTPSQQASKSTTSLGFTVHREYIPNQNNVSFIVDPDKNNTSDDAFSKLQDNNNNNKLFIAYPCDDAVDVKASNYITSVQERFKLEQTINSDHHPKCHENEIPNS